MSYLAKCGLNEYNGPCGHNSCEGCEILLGHVACRPYCVPGCQCFAGYRRNTAGVCIPESQCFTVPASPVLLAAAAAPKRCGQNEYWGTCGHNSCEGCIVFLQQAACRPFCTPGCQCFAGYRRNNAGVCIPEQQCV
jgi:hypothetical protein